MADFINSVTNGRILCFAIKVSICIVRGGMMVVRTSYSSALSLCVCVCRCICSASA